MRRSRKKKAGEGGMEAGKGAAKEREQDKKKKSTVERKKAFKRMNIT